MDRYRFILADRQGELFRVRLTSRRFEEGEIYQLGNELVALCENEGCKKMALELGPESPDCMYSVFLAKLIAVRNTLQRNGGRLVLYSLSPQAFRIFEACALDREFTFAPDFAAASALLASDAPQ